MEYMFIYYEKCSTCKKALAHLKEMEINIKIRPIKEENPTKEELTMWSKEGNIPLRKLFNTSGLLYKELGLSKKMDSLSDDEKLDLLSSNGMLVKRPILVGNGKVLVGYNKDKYNELKEM